MILSEALQVVKELPHYFNLKIKSVVSPAVSYEEVLQTILSFFSQVEAEMPEKKPFPSSMRYDQSCSQCGQVLYSENIGFNSAITACQAVVAKLQAELKQCQELYLKLQNDFADSEAENADLKKAGEILTDEVNKLEGQVQEKVSEEEILEILYRHTIHPAGTYSSWSIRGEEKGLDDLAKALYQRIAGGKR